MKVLFLLLTIVKEDGKVEELYKTISSSEVEECQLEANKINQVMFQVMANVIATCQFVDWNTNG